MLLKDSQRILRFTVFIFSQFECVDVQNQDFFSEKTDFFPS